MVNGAKLMLVLGDDKFLPFVFFFGMNKILTGNMFFILLIAFFPKLEVKSKGHFKLLCHVSNGIMKCSNEIFE